MLKRFLREVIRDITQNTDDYTNGFLMLYAARVLNRAFYWHVYPELKYWVTSFFKFFKKIIDYFV